MISLDKVRKLLGKTGKNMTDEEILKLESKIRIFANLMIDRVIEEIKKKNTKICH